MLRVRFRASGKMKLRDASVLLSYTWLVVTVLGSCLPMLHVLTTLLVKINSSLLFGCELQLLREERIEEQRKSVMSFGLCSATVLALVLLAV
eukprot:3279921-Amphidinium_carterae.1